jgi:hypothetical protein
MVAAYQTIYDSEIWQQSQCIWHENAVMDYLRTQLSALGYQSCSDSGKIWQRGDRCVIVCVVDDFTSCSQDWSTHTPYLFDPDTVVITDNWVSCPTQYQVLRLPDSFFGIYAHVPLPRVWQPDRRFCFTAKRLDNKRMSLMLELQMRSDLMGMPKDIDLVNFGCWSWDGDNTSDSGLRSNWDRQYDLLDDSLRQIYSDTYQSLRPRMPLLNHGHDLEQAHHGAWINLVVETYSSDLVVAFSEKIFRALTIPVPWMLWGGRHSVARLASLGFDTLPDVIHHRYDHMIEQQTAAFGDKTVDWIFDANESVKKLQSLPQQALHARLKQSAEHNQKLLADMRKKWPTDFAVWWHSVVPRIA